MLLKIAQALDAVGLRKLVATAATAAYRGQTFSVDSEGRWVNAQAEAVIVSPTIYTSSFGELRKRVFDYWCFRYSPQPGDVVVDAGAGIGEEAVVLAPLVGTVIAIEAEPSVFACLQESVRRSNLANIRTVHCAVSDKAGTARINSAHIASSIMNDNGAEVPQATIEQLTSDLPKIDFLRMNIEGAEKLAVHGVPWGKVAAAVISCHDFIGVPAKAEVRTVLEREGFQVETRDRPEPWVRDYLYAVRP